MAPGTDRVAIRARAVLITVCTIDGPLTMFFAFSAG
jgi:hypothetical protein